MVESNSDYFSIQIDNLKIIALSCGNLIENGWLTGIAPENYERLLSQAGLVKESGGIRTSNTSFLVDDGNRIFMIDAGSNYDGNPEMLKDNLEKTGYKTNQISAILLTHLHDDHYLGLTDRKGQAIFPKAELYYAKKDGNFHPHGYTVKTFNNDDVLLGKIQTLDLPGHTPGHTGYKIEADNGQTVVFFGDIVQSFAIQLPQPEVSSIFDTNPRLGNQSRRKILEAVADKSILIGGSHMPFPSLGYVVKVGNAYAWKAINTSVNDTH